MSIAENALYKDTNAKSAVLLDPDWLQALEDATIPLEYPVTYDDTPLSADLAETTLPPSKKIDEIDEIEYVRKHFTGNDEKICVIESKCINHRSRSKDNKITTGAWLACAFDNETRRCPSATQCLRDPTVKIDFKPYSQYTPLYPESPMELPMKPKPALEH